ncbi:hypothetical protein [Gilliamella sp. W8145]|nr:hypothetical protein [Gilliamella sp. W8145]
MANRDVWQGSSLSGTNTADALKRSKAERQSHRNHLRSHRGSW